MNYKNGYKVVYEIAEDGKRTFYATKSNSYPTRDEAGNIVDTILASFNDADFAGKTIYEYAGEFYVSTNALPEYNDDGTPKDSKIEGFEQIFVEESDSSVEDDSANTTESIEESTENAGPTFDLPTLEEEEEE